MSAHPQWNLDGLFYAALMDAGPASASNRHAHVYAELAREVPQAERAMLEEGSTYRHKLHESADIFALQLPFYTSRPLYYWLGRALTAAHVSCIRAPYIVSLTFFVLIGLMLPLWALHVRASARVAFTFGAVAVWLPELRDLGSLATPDALATALVGAAALASMSSLRLAVPWLAAAVLARPDVVILGLGVIVASWYQSRSSARAREACAIAVVMVLGGIAVVYFTGGYGWRTVIRHTFIERVVDPSALQQGLSVRAYLKALGRGLSGYGTMHPPSLIPYLALAALAGALSQKRRQNLASERHASMRVGTTLLGFIWLATSLRFLLMPLAADRLFAPAYFCTLAIACMVVALRTQARSSPASDLHSDRPMITRVDGDHSGSEQSPREELPQSSARSRLN